MMRRMGWLGLIVSASACGSAAHPPASPAPAQNAYTAYTGVFAAPVALPQGGAPLAFPPSAEPKPSQTPGSAEETELSPQHSDEGEHSDDGEEIDDGEDESGSDASQAQAPALPSVLSGLREEEITEKLRANPGAFGPVSVGYTNRGVLVAGVQMPAGDQWELVDPSHAWGTQETVDFLKRSIQKVNEQFPGAPKLFIGHISAKKGGHLSPHVSHQSGRDVDISYYLLNGKRGFVKANATNLDTEKTWSFVKALITETDVEMILIDTSIQKLLNNYAYRIGEDPLWLDSIFQVRNKHQRPLVRHAKGHANHIHIRFYNPVAQELGRRAHGLFANLFVSTVNEAPPKKAASPAAQSFFLHKARSGDTLGILAKRYGTSVEAIREINGLKSDAIKNKQVLKIPKQKQASPPAVYVRPKRPSGPPPAPGPVNVPPRRLPPSKAIEASKTASAAAL